MTPTERSHQISTIPLSHWLNGKISPDTPPSSLWRLSSPEPPSRFRKQPCHYLELTRQLALGGESEIGLFLGFKSSLHLNEMDIWVRIASLDETAYLPRNLRLMVLDGDREVVMQATTRETQQIQLEFSAEIGEIFGVKMQFDRIDFFEEFTV
ncbi:DUF1822 family protein [Baaleninema sp.]|uniref:DUF1822 family protein n=1 Tax=Baaleninema sp. TaxID=3101197 RepID=UPI003D011B47